MIQFIDNTIKLKKNKNEFLDINSILNNQMDEVISEIQSKLTLISSDHDAEIILTGKKDNFSLKIQSENTESVKLIEELVNDYLK
ncbi:MULTISPECIES: hypothetical protein [Tenacibaculum]|uniref:hypothetical protein n=1 Tax=Tenacibaculum TaxID=104267 RepID=UPI001F0A3A76|nr:MULTISPECIES: hypothetical protein [Tenacibaculum]MCH3881266.1 hypothetical protein [Tenacibaculum aquimarinum]MDO6599140.1 hypothetical protein [Tenacibaculum sp. 1_MG-2023]